jgi:hypothetical protein
MKLYNSLSVAQISLKNDEMRSAFLREFTSFNVLDADYVAEKYGDKPDEDMGNYADVTDLRPVSMENVVLQESQP